MSEEERPLQEARQALYQTSESGSAGSVPASANKPSSKLLVGGILLVLALVIVGLFLPPISLGERLAQPTPIPTPAIVENLSIPGEITLTVTDPTGVNVQKVSQAEFLAGSMPAEWQAALAALPSNTSLRSSVYTIASASGVLPEGWATITVPADALPYETLDLYGWNGGAWLFLPSQSDPIASQIASQNGPLPFAFALMQTQKPTLPAVGLELLPNQTISADWLPRLTDVSAAGLTLGENGQLNGEVAQLAQGGYRQWLVVSNRAAVVDQTNLVNLLNNPTAQQEQIVTLNQKVTEGGYAGIHLDYQAVPTEHRENFTQFVTDLASALQEQGKALALTLGTPTLLPDGTWDSAGQDWVALGRVANAIYLQMPLNPTLYADGNVAQQLLNLAVRQIDRNKITLLTTINSIEGVGEAYRQLTDEEAIAPLGELEFVEGGEELEKGQNVELALAGTTTPLEWDSNSVSYKYTYQANDTPHTIWLHNEAALNYRMRFATLYNLRGVVFHNQATSELRAGNLLALLSYLGEADPPTPQGVAIVWTVTNAAGVVQTNSNSETPSYSWQAPETPGAYTIQVDLAQGDAITPLDNVTVTILEPVVEATPDPNGIRLTAIANSAANVRKGPATNYGVIAGLGKGTTVTLIGRNEEADWVLAITPPENLEGWIFANLLDIQGDPNSLAFVEAPPLPVAASVVNPPPAPVIVPAAAGNLALGGQTHTLAHPIEMLSSGMTWVKFQHKWSPGDDPSVVAGRISSGHASGFKVLLSIPGAASYPSSIDFASYVQFLGGVAALGPDAIEVWNEMNIDFEWPAGQIDPATYVNQMLAPAYNAIKSANGGVMVISGAPAPTGFDNGTNAWADNRYMAGVAAAGGAAYMDCIGVHHNAGATSPNSVSGHPAGSAHYSWYFIPTMDMYYNAFGGARPVCFTELGYLSGEDFGGVPSRFSWAANTTVAQHAQWLAEAASVAGNSGKVSLLIIFNVDFTYYADDPQAGYAMIRPNGGCPACSSLAQVMGR